MNGRLALVLAFALAALAPSLHAQQPPAQAQPIDAQAVAAERVWRNYQQRIAVLLAESGQPRELALAAVLRDMTANDPDGRLPEDAVSSAWRQSATQNAGADVIANSMLMMGTEAGAALREQAALVLSFGAMTWPHQLVRIMLAEQLYRAAAMLANHPYHRA